LNSYTEWKNGKFFPSTSPITKESIVIFEINSTFPTNNKGGIRW
jgi:hypothetical protein